MPAQEECDECPEIDDAFDDEEGATATPSPSGPTQEYFSPQRIFLTTARRCSTTVLVRCRVPWKIPRVLTFTFDCTHPE